MPAAPSRWRCAKVPEPAHTLDTSGLQCPLPLFHVRDALFDLEEGEVLEVLADDPQAPSDFERWCPRNGHVLLEVRTQGRAFVIRIQKGKETGPSQAP